MHCSELFVVLKVVQKQTLGEVGTQSRIKAQANYTQRLLLHYL